MSERNPSLDESMFGRRLAAHGIAAVAINLPFVLCHPAWPLVQWPPLAALMIGLVLLVAPGVPWAAVLLGRRADRLHRMKPQRRAIARREFRGFLRIARLVVIAESRSGPPGRDANYAR
jgi:hypothetical protein